MSSFGQFRRTFIALGDIVNMNKQYLDSYVSIWFPPLDEERNWVIDFFTHNLGGSTERTRVALKNQYTT